MAKFTINRGYDSEQSAEAEWYETNGDFIDFLSRNGANPIGKDQILRVRADQIFKIELEKSFKIELEKS